jgi:hypothetical protein
MAHFLLAKYTPIYRNDSVEENAVNTIIVISVFLMHLIFLNSFNYNNRIIKPKFLFLNH